MSDASMHHRSLGFTSLGAALSGAVFGGVFFAAPVVVQDVTAYVFNRGLQYESTWWWAHGFPLALELTGGAISGGLTGLVFFAAFRRRRFPRPVGRVLLAVLGAVVLIPAALTLKSILAYERANAPRVIESTGVIQRIDQSMTVGSIVSAPMLWGFPLRNPDHGLRWMRRAVAFTPTREPPNRIMPNGFDIYLDAARIGRVDMKGLDPPTRVWGATFVPEPDAPEMLVLLVGMRDSLRPINNRALLLFILPDGSRAHAEVLRMDTDNDSDPRLQIARLPGGRQDVLVNLGAPLRYGIRSPSVSAR